MLAKASSPDQAARLSVSQIRAALKRGGRQRNLDTRAGEIQTALRSPQLAASPAVTAAFAATTQALVEVIAGLNTQIGALEAELTNHFEQHPDADIYLSLPGLGDVLGARVLGEFGDDPQRYASAKSRRNYAGTSPLTIASGKKRAVLARHVRNRRLYDAIDQWAFCSLQASPGCRDFYDQQRAAGDLHHQALRALANRPRRLSPRLPPKPRHLQRTHRLGPPTTTNTRRSLTRYNPGVSRAISPSTPEGSFRRAPRHPKTSP